MSRRRKKKTQDQVIKWVGVVVAGEGKGQRYEYQEVRSAVSPRKMGRVIREEYKEFFDLTETEISGKIVKVRPAVSKELYSALKASVKPSKKHYKLEIENSFQEGFKEWSEANKEHFYELPKAMQDKIKKIAITYTHQVSKLEDTTLPMHIRIEGGWLDNLVGNVRDGKERKAIKMIRNLEQREKIRVRFNRNFDDYDAYLVEVISRYPELLYLIDVMDTVDWHNAVQNSDTWRQIMSATKDLDHKNITPKQYVVRLEQITGLDLGSDQIHEDMDIPIE